MLLKKLHCLLVILIIAGAALPAQAGVIKVATLSPDGSNWMRKMREGAQQVARATDNRVRFKFYSGGVMGNDMAVLRKIRVGQLQGGAFPGATLSGYFGDVQIYGLPMMFKTLAEVDYVRPHMDMAVIKGLAENGFVIFGLADGGVAYVMSRNPVDRIDDLRQLKAWIPDNNKMTAQAMKGFGIHPISLPIADVRTGLQTGLIDTVAISPVGAIILQWHTQIKYLTKLPLVYLYGILAVDRKAFERIKPADQALVHQILGQIWQEMDAMNRQDNIKALKTLQTQGVRFIEPSADALTEWNTRVDDVNQQIVDAGHVSSAAIERLKSLLHEYRARPPQQPQ